MYPRACLSLFTVLNSTGGSTVQRGDPLCFSYRVTPNLEQQATGPLGRIGFGVMAGLATSLLVVSLELPSCRIVFEVGGLHHGLSDLGGPSPHRDRTTSSHPKAGKSKKLKILFS